MKILFLHGWKSVPGGVKPTHLKTRGHEVINPALHDNDFAEAVRTAQTEFDKHQPQVVVGSSRGGAVAMHINTGDVGSSCSARHGEELVRNGGLPESALIEVGSDHRLADPESLEETLAACERGRR